jgi:hypothetical protein
MDPVIAVNFAFCVVIVILGYLAYKKKRDTLPILIGTAFGLFGISHLLTLLSFNEATFLITIRGLAYLIVIFALYRFLISQRKPK